MPSSEHGRSVQPPLTWRKAMAANNWLPDIICAIRAHGGTAFLDKIYEWIYSNRNHLPDSSEEMIRATIYRHSSDSRAFVNGNPDVFCKKGRGLWALRDPSVTISGKRDAEQELTVRALSNMSEKDLEQYAGRGDELTKDIKAIVTGQLRKLGIN